MIHLLCNTQSSGWKVRLETGDMTNCSCWTSVLFSSYSYVSYNREKQNNLYNGWHTHPLNTHVHVFTSTFIRLSLSLCCVSIKWSCTLLVHTVSSWCKDSQLTVLCGVYSVLQCVAHMAHSLIQIHLLSNHSLAFAISRQDMMLFLLFKFSSVSQLLYPSLSLSMGELQSYVMHV